jgi:hypothetical protein
MPTLEWLRYGALGLGLALAAYSFFLVRSALKTHPLDTPRVVVLVVYMVFSLALAGGGFYAEYAAKHEPRACYEMPGWPKGRWFNWGRFENAPTAKNTDKWKRIPQVWPEVVFTSNQAYESETEQKTNDPRGRAYKAHVQEGETVRPGATIHFKGKDETGYEMTERLTVTPDGCMMTGTTSDTDGNFGPYYYLYESEHYYVTP